MNNLKTANEQVGGAAAHPLLRRLGNVTTLSENDFQSLSNAQRNRVKLSAGSDLFRSGQDLSSVYVVQSGWILLHTLFDDGRRQIFAVALPGDIIAESAAYRTAASYSASALTNAELAAIHPKAFLDLRSGSSALSHAFGTNSVRDTAILNDQILRLGRLTAYERHCHLMLELFYRLDDIGSVEDGWMPWPLKQIDIADILGLSLVHVNRTLMQLKRDGLITIEKRRLKLENIPQMMAISGFEVSRIRPEAA